MFPKMKIIKTIRLGQKNQNTEPTYNEMNKKLFSMSTPKLNLIANTKQESLEGYLEFYFPWPI